MEPAAWVWLGGVLGFGILAAYIDIDSFFRGARVSYTARGNHSFLFFLVLNGLLSAAFLFWALSSGQDSPINKVLQVESSLGKAVIVGFGVPLLFRSKLFSFGEDQKAAGPAFAYDWMRLKVLYSLNQYSAEQKDKIATQYAQKYVNTAGFPERIKGYVDDYVRPFSTQAQKDDLQREFESIQARYAAAGSLGDEHLRAVIRWAMDSSGIAYIQRRLG
jgi:hypothetical protein